MSARGVWWFGREKEQREEKCRSIPERERRCWIICEFARILPAMICSWASGMKGCKARPSSGRCSACYATHAASSAIGSDPIVKQASIAILSPGWVAGSILTIRVSGQIPNFIGAFAPGLPGSFPVSAQATFRQEGW